MIKWISVKDRLPKPPKDDDVVVVRTLRLTSPYMRGDDVKHTQERLAAGIGRHHIRND